MTGRHEMVVDTDIGIPMRDGAVLRANFYHPKAAGKFPVLMTFGPYGKDVPLKEFMTEAWDTLTRHYPEILEHSSCQHLVFETPDPECFVPDGYVVIKVDSRGAGKSPGRLSPNSPEEFRDFYDAVEWAGVQPWSNGKVGLLGISYYAAGQWSVAAMKPPHLAALLPWQGTYDFYRDRTRADGIFAGGFLGRWWKNSVLRNQHGNPESPYRDLYGSGRTTGSESLSQEQLAANRADYLGDLLAHPLNDAWYQSRTPDVSKIDVPTLVVANWGGLGLHLRGTIGGFVGISSQEKWLKVQGGSYFHTFLQPQNVALQKRFFDKYLKGLDNGWEKEPKIEVQIRAPGDKIKRQAQSTSWPLAEAKHVKFYLDAGTKALGTAAPSAAASAAYPSLTQGVNFTTAKFEQDTEIVGPVMLKLFISSSTADMDIFATLCAFDPEGKEMTFIGAPEPACPVTQGWLRASQRKTDPKRSSDYFPYHPHDEKQRLTPGEVYEIEVEVWPMGVYLPKGSTLKLIVAGTDFERPGSKPPFQGVAWFTHNDPRDRPPAIYDSTNTLHTGGARQSYLLLPVLS
ncbi:MAG TPA: CocE/NonD family hydrolase [Stellaceae bacterium]|nr:CocE/NonD family hydrolase [Stellaceae bacterium]